MNIDHLKAFHRVAQTGNFTKAARDLFLTQPAVSMQIQSLEHHLGAVLFDRSRRKVNLTGKGKVLFAYTQKIFKLVEDMQEEFQDLDTLHTGNLVLGGSAIMSAYYLPSFITTFHKRYPGVTYTLAVHNSHTIAEMVYQGKLEIGFCGSSSSHPGLHTQFLHREPLIVVTGRHSVLAKRTAPLTAEDLQGHPFIMREQGTRVTNKVLGWFRQYAQSTTPPAFMTVDNMEAAKQLVISGMGIAAMPRYAANLELAAGQMVPLQLDSFDLHVDYFLVYMEGQKLSRVTQRFLAHMFEQGVPLPEDVIRQSGESCEHIHAKSDL